MGFQSSEHSRTLTGAELSGDWQEALRHALLRAGHPVTGSEWCGLLGQGLASGALELVAVGTGAGSPCGLLVEVHAGHRLIALVVGEPHDRALMALLGALQARSLVVSFDQGLAGMASAPPAALGFMPYIRQTFLQDLTLLSQPSARALPAGLTLHRWTPDIAQRLGALIATVNTGTLDGLFWCAPAAPTQAQCECVWQRTLSDATNTRLADASFVLRDGEHAVAAVIVGVHEDVPTLLELAVAPEWQGQGLSRHLVDAAQQALLAAGHSRMRFYTTASNTRVHRLFVPAEILTQTSTEGWVWLNEAGMRAATG